MSWLTESECVIGSQRLEGRGHQRNPKSKGDVRSCLIVQTSGAGFRHELGEKSANTGSQGQREDGLKKGDIRKVPDAASRGVTKPMGVENGHNSAGGNPCTLGQRA